MSYLLKILTKTFQTAAVQTDDAYFWKNCIVCNELWIKNMFHISFVILRSLYILEHFYDQLLLKLDGIEPLSIVAGFRSNVY